MDTHPDIATAEALATGDLEVIGRLPFSSNAAFLVAVHPAGDLGDPGSTGGTGGTASHDGSPPGGKPLTAVYKPAAGERPLVDFPPGLYRREVATHLLAESLGWDLVPPTVLRRDGPAGEGSLQAFIDHDPDEHYFVLLESGRVDDQLRRLAVFDLVANSADRKGGHVLLDANGHVWAIDNGLTLHAQFKLRTVVWDFAGEPIPDDLLGCVAALTEPGGVPDDLAGLLDPFERDALVGRAEAVIDAGVFPHDPTGRRWPWPPV